ncbi:hypothetical protein O59_003396 [Cellvibrio sp. BR]|nr:hypothetical protein O59_003396 [Cellvibrio sp. BR]
MYTRAQFVRAINSHFAHFFCCFAPGLMPCDKSETAFT